MLPPGVTVQIYLENVPGSTPAEKVQSWFTQFDALSDLEKRSIAGVAPHGFTGGSTAITPEVFALWATAASVRGLRCGVAFGVGDTTNARARGLYYGQIGAMEQCVGVVLDIETRPWESTGAAAAATAMCEAFREVAPRQTLVCQTWHVPTSHMGLPYATFAKYIDSFSSMDYFNEKFFVDNYGRNRYFTLKGWFDWSWGKLQQTVLGPARGARAVPPRNHTFQSYGWDDITTSLVSCLCDAQNGPILLWEQNNSTASPRWWLPRQTQIALGRWQALRERFLATNTAVFDFQAANPPLVVDGLCGPATAAVLGVP